MRVAPRLEAEVEAARETHEARTLAGGEEAHLSGELRALLGADEGDELGEAAIVAATRGHERAADAIEPDEPRARVSESARVARHQLVLPVREPLRLERGRW